MTKPIRNSLIATFGALALCLVVALMFPGIKVKSGVYPSVPPGDITLVPPVFDNIPILATITGYEMAGPTASDAITGYPSGYLLSNRTEPPLYRPYNRDDPKWWDNLVEELIASRVHVVLLHGRGCIDPVSGFEGNGGMCPRHLTKFADAVNRANAQNIIRVSMWDDTFAYKGARAEYRCRNEPLLPEYPNTPYVVPPDGMQKCLTAEYNIPFNLSNAVWRDKVIWERNIKVWHDTVPQNLWFRGVDGRPIIALWSIDGSPEGGIFFNQQGNASLLLGEIRQKFINTYGEDPIFILDNTWIQMDTTIATSGLAYGVNMWFIPAFNTFTYQLWNGQQFGAAVPGFRNSNTPPGCGAGCQERIRDNGNTLSAALQEGYDLKARFVLLEGWTDIAEYAGYYRSNSWQFPNQYINIVREFADRGTKTLRLQAEACDTFSDTTPANLGGDYRDGALDIKALSGSEGNGWYVGWTAANEWVQFSDVLLSEGTYLFSARASSGSPGKTVRLEVGGVSIGSVSVPYGGGLSVYDTFTLGSKFVIQGKHNLRLVFEQGSINLDWIFVKKIDKSVGFKAINGVNFMVAEAGGGDTTYANRTAQGPWETFTLIDINGGNLVSGDTIRLQTHNGYFVVAENGGTPDQEPSPNARVKANRLLPSIWEQFTVEKVSGSPGSTIIDNDQVAIKSYNGYYFTAINGGGDEVYANRRQILSWETFTIKIAQQ